MPKSALLIFDNRKQWHKWLEAHHATESEVWVMHFKKKYREQGLTLDEAVEEALCFGWIDSTLNTIDERCYALRYTPRKSNSVWSMSNITRAEKLIAEGKMTGAGLAKITEAKENRQWQAAIQREDTDAMPEALLMALSKEQGALAAYQALPSSKKKQYLYWLNTAKQEQTKNRRIQKIIDALMGR